MRKNYLGGLAVFALIMAGCSNENEQLFEGNSQEVFSGEIITAGSRTELGDNGKTLWSEKDAINLFKRTGYYQKYEVETGGDITANFKYGGISTKGNALDQHYAVYPYAESNTINGTTIKLNLSSLAEQTYVENTFDASDAVMVAKSSTTALPFTNTLSMAKVNLSIGEAVQEATVSSVKFVSTNKALTGEATVDMSKDRQPAIISGDGKEIKLTANDVALSGEATPFYIVMPAGEYTNLKLVICAKLNGGELMEFTKEYDYAINFQRSMIETFTIQFLDDADWTGSNEVILKSVADASTASEALKTNAGVKITDATGASEQSPITIPAKSEDAASVGHVIDLSSATMPEGESAVNITVEEGDGSTSTVKELEVIVPEGTSGNNLNINAPGTTVTITTENGTVIDVIEATTADETLIIGKDVTVEELKIKKGNVRLNGKVQKISSDVNTTITLENDLTLDEIVKIEGEGHITIDLNGKTVTSTAKKAFEVYTNATFKNGTIIGANRCVDTRKNVELTLDNVTLIADDYTTEFSNPQPLTIGGNDHGTKVTISNSSISAKAGYCIITFVKTELTAEDSAFDGYNALYVKNGSDNSTFNFNSSTLSGSTGNNDVSGNSFSVIAVRADNVTVNVDAKSRIVAEGNYCSAMSVINSARTEESNNSSIIVQGTITANNILGGILDNNNTIKVPVTYTTNLNEHGYMTNDCEDGLVEITGVAEAYANGTLYNNFEEAWEAKKGGEFKLFSDVTITKTLKPESDCVIDGNNHTISFTEQDTNRIIDVVKETNGASLTLKNVTLLNNVSWVERGVNYNTNGTLTLDNVTIKNAENCSMNYAVNLPGSSDNCKVVINNCNIGATANALNVWGENSKINVTDSDLYVIDNSEVESYSVISLNNDGAGNTADGSVVTVTGGSLRVTGTYADGSKAVRNSTASGKVEISDETEVEGGIIETFAIVTYGNSPHYYAFTTLQGAVDKAASSNGEARMIRNIEECAVNTKAPYGNYYGINHYGGVVLNGQDYTLDFNVGELHNNKLDNYGIMTSGGTIRNMTITGVFRAIMIMNPTETVYIDNVTIGDKDVCYAINTGEGDGTHDVVVTNSTIKGWSSYGTAVKSVSFTNCTFAQGEYYDNVYGRLVKPYVDCVFENCEFNSKFYIDLSQLGKDGDGNVLNENVKVTLKNCTVNGVKLTTENWSQLIVAEESCGEGQISVELKDGSYLKADNTVNYVVIE